PQLAEEEEIPEAERHDDAEEATNQACGKRLQRLADGGRLRGGSSFGGQRGSVAGSEGATALRGGLSGVMMPMAHSKCKVQAIQRQLLGLALGPFRRAFQIAV